MVESLFIFIFIYGIFEKIERELLDVVNKNFDFRFGVIVRYKCSRCSVEVVFFFFRFSFAGAGVGKEDFLFFGRRGFLVFVLCRVYFKRSTFGVRVEGFLGFLLVGRYRYGWVGYF